MSIAFRRQAALSVAGTDITPGLAAVVLRHCATPLSPLHARWACRILRRLRVRSTPPRRQPFFHFSVATCGRVGQRYFSAPQRRYITYKLYMHTDKARNALRMGSTTQSTLPANIRAI